MLAVFLRKRKIKMNRLTLSIIIVILIFGIGFFAGRISTSDNTERDPIIDGAITNIVNYTNYVDKLEYITNNNIEYEELKKMYNDLLKRSKEVAISYDTLLVSYEKLEKKANRKLYFLVGGELEYNIDREAIDLGINAGVEYKQVIYQVGYLFFDKQISLSIGYRF